MKFFILDFEISLPPIPQFENKSWNFSFWILKSHYRQYQSLKIKVEILYSHFGFLNLTFYLFHDFNYLRTWHYLLLFYKTGAFYTYILYLHFIPTGATLGSHACTCKKVLTLLSFPDDICALTNSIALTFIQFLLKVKTLKI